MAKSASAWALCQPNGQPIAATVRVEKRDAEAVAYDYLFYQYDWPKSYWKDWHGFVEARESRGWVVRRVRITVSSPVGPTGVTSEGRP